MTMDTPRLKFNNKYIGLRRTSENNVFEPKNNKLFCKAVDSTAPLSSSLVVVACFQNCQIDLRAKLSEIERQMVGNRWNLVVIDNGSSDDTYSGIIHHKTTASEFIHAKIDKITNKDKLEDVCRRYSKPLLTNTSHERIIIDNSVVLEHHSIKSFSCVGTYEVKKELALCIYSIRCFHAEPIYVVCDTETKKYIKDIDNLIG